MNSLIHPYYRHGKNEINEMIDNFANDGEVFVKGKRNVIKRFAFETTTLNIKSFKIPNPVNAVVYRFFRKTKARRSFEYANYLIQNGFGTPKPVAYFENFSPFLRDSYYVSEHLVADLMFRDLTTNPDYPDHENILRQFTRFSYALHQKGIEFKDHSPGNTLIKKAGDGKYEFFLVDLNRMDFHKTMSLELRMKNLSRLTPKREMLIIMSNEYAKVSGHPEKLVSDTLIRLTENFQRKFHRKKRLKNKFLPGRK